MTRPIRLIHFRALNFWAVLAGVSIITLVAGMFVYDLGTAAGKRADAAIIDGTTPVAAPLEAASPNLQDLRDMPLPAEVVTAKVKKDGLTGNIINVDATLLQPTSPDVTPERVRDLARHLHNAAMKNQNKRTSYIVAIYAGAEYAKRGNLALVRLTVGPVWDFEIITSEKQFVVINAPPEERLGLSQERRMAIYRRSWAGEDQAFREHNIAMPPWPNHNLEPGDELKLTSEVALMAHHLDESADFTVEQIKASLSRMGHMLPGMTIKILDRRPVADMPLSDAWYFVEAFGAMGDSLGAGWVNPAGLRYNLTKDGLDHVGYQAQQTRHLGQLFQRYTAALAEAEGISIDVLNQITSEGVEKGWPY